MSHAQTILSDWFKGAMFELFLLFEFLASDGKVLMSKLGSVSMFLAQIQNSSATWATPQQFLKTFGGEARPSTCGQDLK